MNKNATIIYKHSHIHTRKFLINLVQSMKEIDRMALSFCDKENQKRREGDGKNVDCKNRFALSPSNQLQNI